MAGLLDLPREITTQILELVWRTSYVTLLDLAVVSKAMHVQTVPILYRTVHTVIRSPSFSDAAQEERTVKALQFCRTIVRNPQLASLVRNVFIDYRIFQENDVHSDGLLSLMHQFSEPANVLVERIIRSNVSAAENPLIFAKWSDLIEKRAAEAIIILSIAQLPHIRRLWLSCGHNSSSKTRVLEYIEDLRGFDFSSQEGSQGLFPKLEVLCLEDYNYLDESDRNHDDRGLACLINLPSLQHLRLEFWGDEECQQASDVISQLTPRSSQVSTIEIGGESNLDPRDLVPLLEACKALVTLRYMMPFWTPWHQSRSVMLQQALLTQSASLQHLVLTRGEWAADGRDVMTVEAIDLSGLSQLRTLEISMYYLFGDSAVDHDLGRELPDEQGAIDQMSTRHLLRRHLPPSIEELSITDCYEDNMYARLDLALSQLLRSDDPDFNRLCLIDDKSGTFYYRSGIQFMRADDDQFGLRSAIQLAAKRGISTRPIEFRDGILQERPPEPVRTGPARGTHKVRGGLNLYEQRELREGNSTA